MYKTSDIRKGLKIEVDGHPYNIVEFMFVKPGKGTAFTRTKLKNLITGAVIDRTWRSGEALEPAPVEELTMQYMYNDGDEYHFMDTETFNQIAITASSIESEAKWLVEDSIVPVLLYKGRPVSIDLPNFVELEITYCEPGVKGNTAQGGVKPATLSTGATVNVPLFVEKGTWIKIDTRTEQYVERVRK